jgi:peptidyl-prolyl cis-trans isomerase D
LAFKDKAAADAAYATLSKAPNFIEAAGKLGYKDSDIDLGVVTKRDLIDSKIAEAAFGLKKDEVSRPVEGQFTTVILRATDITPGTNKTFDDVKAQVKDQLVDERAGKELQAMHDKVEDERAAGKTLKDAAAKLNLTFKEIEAVDRAGLGADGKPVLDHPDTARIMNGVFAAALGVEAEAVELSDRGFAWFDVLGTTPEKEKPFDTIKADVKTTWMEIEKAKALGEAAAGLVSRLIKGEPIETLAKEAGGVVEKTPAIKRTTSPPGLTADAVRQAFALPIGAASSSPTADNKSRTVFRVAEVTPAAAPTKEEADKLRGEMLRGMQADALNAYVAGLQKRYGVTVNNAVLSQTLGLDRQTR